MKYFLLDFSYYTKGIDSCGVYLNPVISEYEYIKYMDNIERSFLRLLIKSEAIEDNIYFFYKKTEYDYFYSILSYIPYDEGMNLFNLGTDEKDTLIEINNIIKSSEYNLLENIDIDVFLKDYLKIFFILLKIKYNIGELVNNLDLLNTIILNISIENNILKINDFINYIMIEKSIRVLENMNIDIR